ncbi:thiamine biosynthesis protein ThiS [Vibrio zhanjiangensis]|uniref:Thiamine biosynthesis protein ThiS n=1 Tax=Vibrio zhanjiangensis TaxID=1046128 RepID=A0ABQ6F0P7_9VIBR|nr:sulfur carrier protein ThiS [Vibrio zhanjiangensis]GLT19072.1 thiamine biosynthesis protein ThiS [Vibrio zhanjiangensis]
MAASTKQVLSECSLNQDFINVEINGDAYQMLNQSNLEQLVSELNVAEVGYVFSINNQIVPHSEWASTILSEGDRISLFQAIAGG